MSIISKPLYPQKRTLELILEMSALCQKRTYALHQNAAVDEVIE
jgi:hypothetical protein